MAKNKKSKSGKITKSHLIAIIAFVVILIALVILFSRATTNSNPVGDNTIVAASVNGENITNAELNRSYSFFFFVSGYPEQYQQMITKEYYLDQKTTEMLLIQEAGKNGISVSDEKLNDGIKRLIVAGNITEQELKSRVEKAGYTYYYMKSYFKNQMIIADLINKTVLSNITIYDADVRNYYNENKDLFVAKEDQRRVWHILLDNYEEAQEIAKEARINPDKFAEFAKEKSIDRASAVYGGDLGIVSKGQMVPEFEDAAFKLGKWEISDPVNTSFGFHVIKVDIAGATIDFEEARDRIKDALLADKQKTAIQEYVEGLKANANIKSYMKAEAANTTQKTPATTEVKASTDSSCYEKYGLTSDTVIFYHANWCPHCQKMMPIVQELEQDDYKFYWAESSDTEATKVVSECFSDVIEGSIPEFICAGTKEYQMGEMSKEDMQGFADDCI
jgi:foldase protein PrsA